MKKTKDLMEGGNDLCARFMQSVTRREAVLMESKLL